MAYGESTGDDDEPVVDRDQRSPLALMLYGSACPRICVTLDGRAVPVAPRRAGAESLEEARPTSSGSFGRFTLG